VNVSARVAVGAWLAFVLACTAIVGRTEFTSDLSAFLPRSPTPAQRLLVEQLRDGVVSRLILAGIEGGAPEALAAASKQLAMTLREQKGLAAVENGEDGASVGSRDFLWRNRYLLSPAVTADRFSTKSLHERLEASLDLIGGASGMLVRRMLPADPTGEMIVLLERLGGSHRPTTRHGVWFSPDGKRALLIAQTHAAGSDIDAQERAVALIRRAFREMSGTNHARLLLTGPGVFAVESRARIKADAVRFSAIATVLIAALLFALYRSPRVLALGLVPVATGALAGIAAVSLGFGAVHGITLGFGVTLIGEGVDYAIYLFSQTAPGVAPRKTLDRIWPTLRLGVLTSICGFSAMLLSGFAGLAQLGLFSIVGLTVAAMVTRQVLPGLMPAGFFATGVVAVAKGAMTMVHRAPKLRIPLLFVVGLAALFLISQDRPLWGNDLTSLSPVPRDQQILDQQLRRDIGAPDVRYLVVVQAKDEEAVLQASETVATALQRATQQGWLRGYDSPAFYLPSRMTQHARQDVLPDTGILRDNLREALQGLPFRPDAFEPFLKDASAAKSMPLLDRTSLEGSGLGAKLDSLLVKRTDGWAAMLPLRGVANPAAIAREIGGGAAMGSVLLDVRGESEELYRSYLREALTHSLLGVVAIAGLLGVSLRSVRRVFDVLAPLAAAVITVTAALVLSGHTLSLFHLVGLLLVVAVGSNYSLFFDRAMPPGPDRERTVVSLLFANVSTMLGFGLLSFSSVPVLNAIGTTVGMGAIMALAFAAIFSRRLEDDAGA
jgi:predicted exporter